MPFILFQILQSKFAKNIRAIVIKSMWLEFFLNSLQAARQQKYYIYIIKAFYMNADWNIDK